MKVNISLNKQETETVKAIVKKLQAEEGRISVASVMRRGMMQLAKSLGIR